MYVCVQEAVGDSDDEDEEDFSGADTYATYIPSKGDPVPAFPNTTVLMLLSVFSLSPSVKLGCRHPDAVVESRYVICGLAPPPSQTRLDCEQVPCAWLHEGGYDCLTE